MKKIFFILYLVLSSCLLCASCDFNNVFSQNTGLLSFTSDQLIDCNEIIFNPDMGFYCADTVTVTRTGVSNKSSIISSIKKAAKPLTGDYPSSGIGSLTFNLVHLKFDISDYSKAVNGNADVESLSEAAISDVKEILEAFRGTEKTAVVRFAYDKNYDGNKNQEPEDFSIILNHVKQIAEVYSQYADVITAIECGIVGPWGEMHSSNYALSVQEEGVWKPDYYIVQIMKEYLEGLNSVEIPFLVRQPKFIYAYLNTYCNVDYDFKLTSENESYPKAIPAFIPQRGTDEYKLGLYNDGYLGSESDSGTFKGPSRSEEIEFLSAFTDHTPYGGELIGNYGIKQDDGTVSVENFADVHVSFLNIGWNEKYLRSFNNLTYSGETLFKYLYKHLGYRYLVKSVAFETGKNLNSVKIKFDFENTGFASLPYHRKKTVRLFFVPSETSVTGSETPVTASGVSFTGQESLTVTADLSGLEEGRYDVYIKLSDQDGTHILRPSNTGWNTKLNAVKVGRLVINVPAE